MQLTPEYQRELCWSIEKMNTFIDTIMKGWIVPNYVIYQLSNAELKSTTINYRYECIDGQHRLKTLKMYIENIIYPNTNKYIYWLSNGERVYYKMAKETLMEISKRRRINCRNMTREEMENVLEVYQNALAHLDLHLDFPSRDKNNLLQFY